MSKIERWWLGLNSTNYLILKIYDMTMAAKSNDFSMAWPAEKAAQALRKYPESAQQAVKTLVYRFYKENPSRNTVIRELRRKQVPTNKGDQCTGK